ncbi:hypothetical protein M758_UG193300 [Ceratodon purpureus]|nr:hypothetical protein M758_UG193300 [Ceratodon purpureus]
MLCRRTDNYPGYAQSWSCCDNTIYSLSPCSTRLLSPVLGFRTLKLPSSEHVQIVLPGWSRTFKKTPNNCRSCSFVSMRDGCKSGLDCPPRIPPAQLK